MARLRSLFMPTAAAVPMTVDTTAAHSASTSVFRTAPSVSRVAEKLLYQFSEKPENTERLFASLKENTSSIAMGAKRNIIIRAV